MFGRKKELHDSAFGIVNCRFHVAFFNVKFVFENYIDNAESRNHLTSITVPSLTCSE
jgi:hypothetical protein